MHKPDVASYGLTENDTLLLETRERRIRSLLLFGVLGLGAIGGLVVGKDLASVLFGAVCCYALGGIVVTFVAGDLVDLIRMFSPRLRSYAAFKTALQAFENWDRRTRTEFWQSPSGHDFEHELGALFLSQGYDVVLTRGSGDQGVDIILRRSGRTTVVQCKQTKSPVGPAVARELFGALVASRADDGILAAVGGVTPGVHAFFDGKPLRVMNLSDILELQAKVPVPSGKLSGD